jgi:hypothetical protein
VVLDGTSIPGLPANPGSLFGSVAASGGPCLVEPQDGTLFPNAWLRPRIAYAPATSSENVVFQVRLHSGAEANDLVVYTTNTAWTLDKPTWEALSNHLVGPPVTVTVAAASTRSGGAAASQPASFTIAPVPAVGSILYFGTETLDPNEPTTAVKGFQIGNEGTLFALIPPQVAQTVDALPDDGGPLGGGRVGVSCVGCHTPTPDGEYLAFTAQSPWPNAVASVDAVTDGAVPVGQPPPWLTPGAAANLSPMSGPANAGGGAFAAPPVENQVMLGMQTFSANHYTTGDRVVVAQLGAAQSDSAIDAGASSGQANSGVVSQLAWFDLEWDGGVPTTGFATAPCGTDPAPPAPCIAVPPSNGGWGILRRDGDDSRSAGAPSWSHTANVDLIAYTSTDVGTKDGRLDQGNADIYVVPYGARGAARRSLCPAPPIPASTSTTRRGPRTTVSSRSTAALRRRPCTRSRRPSSSWSRRRRASPVGRRRSRATESRARSAA